MQRTVNKHTDEPLLRASLGQRLVGRYPQGRTPGGGRQTDWSRGGAEPVTQGHDIPGVGRDVTIDSVLLQTWSLGGRSRLLRWVRRDVVCDFRSG